MSHYHLNMMLAAYLVNVGVGVGLAVAWSNGESELTGKTPFIFDLNPIFDSLAGISPSKILLLAGLRGNA